MHKVTVFFAKVRKRLHLHRHTPALCAAGTNLQRISVVGDSAPTLSDFETQQRLLALQCEVQDMHQAVHLLQRGLSAKV